MKTNLIIIDDKQDELALMSKKALDLYCEEAAVETRKVIRKFAAESREKLKPKTMRSYWRCVISVDLPEGEMPSGADSPLRQAVEQATLALHPEATVIECESGWGLNARGVAAIRKEASLLGNCITWEECGRRDGHK